MLRNPSVWRGLVVQKQRQLIAAALDKSPVSGLTHKFYKYPARFSPVFVRNVISALSEPGDLILDPFMGSGTTLVEALAQGRSAIGADISSLATFVAQAKTTRITAPEAKNLLRWVARVPNEIRSNRSTPLEASWVGGGYQRHLGSQKFWRMRNAIAQCLRTAKNLPHVEEIMARAIILRTAQWALDSRKEVPSLGEFRNTFVAFGSEMIGSASEFTRRVEASLPEQIGLCINCEAAHLQNHVDTPTLPPARIVLTSPPYPGVHVLYHRWQVDGRKETPAPF